MSIVDHFFNLLNPNHNRRCLIFTAFSKAPRAGCHCGVKNKTKQPSQRITSQPGKISQSVSGPPILREACQLHDRGIPSGGPPPACKTANTTYPTPRFSGRYSLVYDLVFHYRYSTAGIPVSSTSYRCLVPVTLQRVSRATSRGAQPPLDGLASLADDERHEPSVSVQASSSSARGWRCWWERPR